MSSREVLNTRVAKPRDELGDPGGVGADQFPDSCTVTKRGR
jgi:hypothetical protein